MNSAQARSDEQYLESLSLAHLETAKLVKDLHALDEHIISSSPSTAGTGPLALVINRAMDDLFVPFIDKDRYINMERDWMLNEFKKHLQVFNLFLVLIAI